jgi:hypothetical protein
MSFSIQYFNLNEILHPWGLTEVAARWPRFSDLDAEALTLIAAALNKRQGG